MIRPIPGLAAASLLLAGVARPASAQLGCSGATCTIELAMPVNDVLRLSLNAGSAGLGTPTETDYTAGFRDVAGTAANVSAKANRSFRVEVNGATPQFTFLGALPNPGKPAADLLWATSAAGLGSTTAHMGAPATLLNQGAGTVTTPLFLRTRWDFARDVPGTYSLGIRFTISAP